MIVTGSHPEYWSTAMLDALEAFQRRGGRLMYLGGNGFYWRVAFSSHFPGVMELRRVGPATRAWASEPGETLHAFTGELGDGPWPDWARDLEPLVIRGSRVMQEVVFFHPPSRTLLVADLCEHFGPHSPLSLRLLTRLARMYDRPRMP